MNSQVGRRGSNLVVGWLSRRLYSTFKKAQAAPAAPVSFWRSFEMITSLFATCVVTQFFMTSYSKMERVELEYKRLLENNALKEEATRLEAEIETLKKTTEIILTTQPQ